MARVTNGILQGQAYSADRAEALLDLTYGGQFGFAPELSEWNSSQAYVRHHFFAYLLEAPKFFQYMPNPDMWVSTLRALVETQPQSIDGLKSTLNVDTDSHPIGGAGEVMEEPINVKRETSSIVFDYGPDRYGMPITAFFQNWISYGIMDPDTKYALSGTLPNNVSTDWLADHYTMTCIFIEPDPQHKRVLKSWLVTNMFPKNTPAIEGKRDITNNMEFAQAQINFTGIVQYSLGVNVLAQRILNNINLTQANPYLRQAFIEEQKQRGFISGFDGRPIFDGDVDASTTEDFQGRTGVGYGPGIDTLSQGASKTRQEAKEANEAIN